MLNFHSFLLERVYKITRQEEDDINELVEKYKDTFFKNTATKFKIHDKTPQVIFKDELDKKGRYILGTLSLRNLETNRDRKVKVVVDFDKEALNRGEFSDFFKEIVLFYYPLGYNEHRIADTITHEMLHAKQHYKKMSKEYTKAIKIRKLPTGEKTFRSNRAYFLDPLEYPVYTTLLAKQFLKLYRTSENLDRIKLKAFLEDFIKSGAKPVFDTRAPDLFLDKQDFLKFLYRNRKHKKYADVYKNFIKKLYWLLNEL